MSYQEDEEKTEPRDFLEILGVFLWIICLGFLEFIFWIRDKIKAFVFQKEPDEGEVIL